MGTPIGSEHRTSTKMDREGGELWDAIPSVADLQCAWQILLQSANPRANHSMQTLPPNLSAAYCDAHDAGIWATARALLGGIPQEDEQARERATLPMRMGGLGLRSAARCAPAAFYRTPEVCRVGGAPVDRRGSSEELRAAAAHLDARGSVGDPVGLDFEKASALLSTTHGIRANDDWQYHPAENNYSYYSKKTLKSSRS